MNNRDQQIAAIVQSTANLDPERLGLYYGKVREAYQKYSTVEQFATIDEIADRAVSDFRVLSNQELRSVQEFNAGNVWWDGYCEDLGRSVALGEEAYLFEVLRESVPESEPSDDDFGGLRNAINDLAAAGRHPDVLIAPTSQMPDFLRDEGDSIDWNSSRRPILRYANHALQVFWSSVTRPLDRFIVFDRRSGVWHVKLDSATGTRLTVAIGEQFTPRHGVVWLAETVAKYEVQALDGFRSFRRSEVPNA